MNEFTTLTALLSALLIGVVSPGPSFLVVAKTAITVSRGAGLVSAIGMGVAGVFLALMALFGLHFLFQSLNWLKPFLFFAGGSYLLYLALMMWRNSYNDVKFGDVSKSEISTSTFWMAFGTMISNPKALIQYGVIFAAILPSTISMKLSLKICLCIFFLEAGWYSIAALVFSSAGPRSIYLNKKVIFDKTASVVMLILALKLFYSAFSF